MKQFILKTSVSSLVLALTTTSAMAQASGQSLPMTADDIRATTLSSDWQNGQNTITMGDDGKVMFLYGKAQPTIVCAAMRLCDLELQAGEKVLNVFSGDSVRWQFDGAVSGPDGNTPHLLIKPIEANQSTTLVITTDRRAYSIHLKSSHSKYMARIGFDYSHEPRDILAAMQPRMSAQPAYVEPVVETKYVATMPGFKSAADLDFDYKISGKARWKPLRVFNDGEKTYIEFDESINNQELPIFQVEGSEGTKALVNSRFIDNRYIIDSVFDEGFLVLGVGRKQDVIKIKRNS